jgi:hypothetical protein
MALRQALPSLPVVRLSSPVVVTLIAGTGRERAVAFDGQRRASGAGLDSGIVLIESPYYVFANEYDGGIAQTGDARPPELSIVHTIDGNVLQPDGGVGDDGSDPLETVSGGFISFAVTRRGAEGRRS